MRKRVIGQDRQADSPVEDRAWLELENLVQADLTSEDPAHPIESALRADNGSGWRARQPGKQTIRLRFDTPHRISHIQLVFEENDAPRTQEFVLRWSADDGASWREIVRQQYNFSPPDAGTEREDYSVDLERLTTLELNIIPDVSGGQTLASLARLRLA